MLNISSNTGQLSYILIKKLDYAAKYQFWGLALKVVY